MMVSSFKTPLTGTVINYYFHCKRQCWLFAHRLNLEDNSEDVRIGRVLHELQKDAARQTEISIANIKIDKLTNEYLVELKKSDADIEAAKWQVLLYLKKLREKGIERIGKLEFVERNKQDRKIHYVELTPDNEARLNALSGEIEEFLSRSLPPETPKGPKCAKCAYYEYCFI